MRQVFLQKPWIYIQEPSEIREIYYKYGTFERLKTGQTVVHGGQNGRFYFLKKGLATFSIQDKTGRNFMLCLILPGMAFADIDGLTHDVVNVTDSVIRPSEVLSISYETWEKYIGSNFKLMMLFSKGLVYKHETCMEAMIANYTLKVDERIRVFWKALLTSFPENIKTGWNMLPVGLKIKEYANLVGASRVTISRLFTKWYKLDLLQKNKRVTAIHSDILNNLYDWAL